METRKLNIMGREMQIREGMTFGELAKEFQGEFSSAILLAKQGHDLKELDYEIKEENLEKMTYYGKANYEMSRANTTEWIEWLPTTMIAKQNTAMLSSNSWGFNDGKETNPFKYYRANESVEPAEYFTKIYKYYKNSWNIK